MRTNYNVGQFIRNTRSYGLKAALSEDLKQTKRLESERLELLIDIGSLAILVPLIPVFFYLAGKAENEFRRKYGRDPNDEEYHNFLLTKIMGRNL